MKWQELHSEFMIKFDKKEVWPLLFILLAALAGAAAYAHLPERVPTHWSAGGVANGWSGRMTAVVLMPVLMLFVYLVLLLVPFVDPLRKNIDSFSVHYRHFRTGLSAALAALQVVILAKGSGYDVPIGPAVMLMLAAVFGLLGRLLPKTKRNYTIGIRLPWTLESDKVWEETHQFAGHVFMGLAAAALAGAFLPGPLALTLFFGALAVGLTVTVVFSYRRYREFHRDRPR